MISLLYILLGVLFWYVCGIINVVIVQATQGDDDFSVYHRGSTLFLCYVPGPFITFLCLGYVLVIKPIKYGTRLGRWLGRLIEDFLE